MRGAVRWLVAGAVTVAAFSATLWLSDALVLPLWIRSTADRWVVAASLAIALAALAALWGADFAQREGKRADGAARPEAGGPPEPAGPADRADLLEPATWQTASSSLVLAPVQVRARTAHPVAGCPPCLPAMPASAQGGLAVVHGGLRSRRPVMTSQVSAPVASAGPAGPGPATRKPAAPAAPAAATRSSSLAGRPSRILVSNRAAGPAGTAGPVGVVVPAPTAGPDATNGAKLALASPRPDWVRSSV